MIGRRGLAEIISLRRLTLSFLSRIPLGDVTIKHHWTGDPVKLHPFFTEATGFMECIESAKRCCA
jgi:hypothetical protein